MKMRVQTQKPVIINAEFRDLRRQRYKEDPNNKISNRIKNILGKSKDCCAFLHSEKGDGWRFYLLEDPKKQYRGKRSKRNREYSNNKYSYNPGSSKKKIKKQGFAHPIPAFLMASGLAILVGTLLFGDFLNANKNLLQPPYKHIQSCWR